MWTEENINSAASTYISNLVVPKEVKYFIREAFIEGAKYVIDNTQKIK